MKKAIITSCSNKFFPSALNLIGSIRTFHPDMPIFVYDLGLSRIFRAELESIPGIVMRQIDMNVAYWRACYTWKSSIFMRPEADLNLYLDAGNEALRPLDGMFDMIESDGYLAVEQGIKVGRVVPGDYVTIFDIPSDMMDKSVITAGVFGFRKSDPAISDVISRLYDASCAGLCLGYSKNELWKNKGVNRTRFIRDCEVFRHDTTLISILLHKHVDGLKIGRTNLYAGADGKNHPGQYLWNMRMNYDELIHVAKAHDLARNAFARSVNRMIISAFVIAKNIRLRIKKSLMK